MIEYDIVCESNFYKFKEVVNKKLKEGWKLQGGICTTNMTPFYQAIYREKSNFDKKQYYNEMFGEQTDEQKS